MTRIRTAPPVAEFCGELQRLHRNSGVSAAVLAKQLSISRSQLYAILSGGITRPPDWNRLVEPLVRACTGDAREVARWRRRHGLLVEVHAELSRRARSTDCPDRRLVPAPPATAIATSTLPLRNPVFTGRVELLDRIAGRLSEGPVAVVALRGLGGVGKSQTALHYAHLARAAGRYEITWWVRADTDLTLMEDLAGLAPVVGVPAGSDREETVAGVRAALQRRGRWLVVFDNAPSPQAVRARLPDGPGHVLVTSRDRGWGEIAAQLDVEVFDRSESTAYLRGRLGHEDPDAGTLAAALGHLPLALAQAASYLDVHGAPPISRYLQLYEQRSGAGQLLAEHAGDAYPHTVATTWLMHFADLDANHPAALQLLRLCARLDPDDIPFELILSRADLLTGSVADLLGSVAATPEGLEAVVGTLARCGLVTRLDGARIRLHRLVADITRQHPAPAGPDPDGGDPPVIDPWADLAVDLLAALLPGQPMDPATWPVSARLAAHAGAVTGRLSVATGSAAVVLATLGRYLRARGDYRQACAVLTRALAAQEAIHGPDHIEVARASGTLGVVQRELKDLTAARTSMDRTLAIFVASYGPDHVEVSRALANLGSIELLLGDLRSAGETLRKALTIAEANCDPGHPELAIILGNLGLVQQALGDLPAARASQERALAIEEAAYGADHAEVASTLTNLGLVQLRSGQPAVARATLQRALAVKEATQGPEHPAVAVTLVTLGAVQEQLGELFAARVSRDRALAIRMKAYGPEHPYVVAGPHDVDELRQQPGSRPAVLG